MNSFGAKTLLTGVLVSALSGCSAPIDLDKIKGDFLARRDIYDQIQKMASLESSVMPTHKPACFEIRRHWSKGWPGKRNNPGFHKISKARYDLYLTLLLRIGASGVSHCPSFNNGWTSITVASSGIAVSGCLTSIELRGDNTVPKSEIKPGYQHRKIPIIGGWFISHHCT